MEIRLNNFSKCDRPTRLIFPVVNAGVMDDLTSFHSCPRIMINIFLMTFERRSKDCQLKGTFKMCWYRIVLTIKI